MNDRQISPTWHPLTQMLALALAYCATGKLGLLLAIPPGYATAIWPPSGIALGVLLVFGRRLWPGVWLGSVLTNLATSLDPSSAGSVARSLLVAAIIGLGAAAQAGLGEALVRHGARRLALINEREAFRFFLRGGPLASLVAATVGVSTLIAAGSVPLSAAPFNWWTWWVGDTIGVLIFTPLVLMWCDRSGEFRKRRWAVTLPIVGTFAAAVLVFVYTTRSESRERKSRFDDEAVQISASLQRRTELNAQVLRSVASLFSASMKVESDEFARFTAPMLASHGDLLAVSWAPHITDKNRAAFEAELPPNLRLRRVYERRGEQYVVAPRRGEYVPILYQQSRGKLNVTGFDLVSEPTRRATLERARDTGEIAASPLLRLQAADYPPEGFLLVQPIYARDGLQTVDERRAYLLGYAIGVLRIGEFVGHADVTALTGRRINLRIDDVTDWSRPETIVTLRQGAEPALANQIGTSNTLAVGGRRWLLSFTPTLEYMTSDTALIMWLVLAGGLVFSGMVGIGALILTGRTSEVEALVRARTDELAEINEKLSFEVCDHIRTEAELKEERTFLKSILDNLHEGIVVLDMQGNTTLTNIAARRTHARITGRVTEQHTWAGNQALYYPDGLTPIPQASLPHSRALKGETIADLEMLAIEPNRKPVVLMVTARPLLTAEGIRSGALSFVRDITETRQADRLKREFISVVSHELRTPLTSIRGSIGLVAHGAAGKLPEKAKELLQVAYRNTERLSLLINDILDIEKIESGRLSLDMQVHSLRGLVEQALAANAGYAQSCGVRLELDPAAPDPLVRADANRLLQVMANLLSNAAKFSPAGAAVEIGIEHEAGRARVTVRDYGPGISAEFQPRMFQKFSQADGSDTRSKPGTGLGLAISKALVEQMHGSIGYETDAGVGTRFYFDLPALADADAA
jgi:signal transduction histidine kinase/CHASE1-domain containing sensor protein